MLRYSTGEILELALFFRGRELVEVKDEQVLRQSRFIRGGAIGKEIGMLATIESAWPKGVVSHCGQLSQGCATHIRRKPSLLAMRVDFEVEIDVIVDEVLAKEAEGFGRAVTVTVVGARGTMKAEG